MNQTWITAALFCGGLVLAGAESDTICINLVGLALMGLAALRIARMEEEDEGN